MNSGVLRIAVLVLLLITPVESQLALARLSEIGIIQGKSYGLKLATAGSNQFLVVKLVPNVERIQNCTASAIQNYKEMLTRILTPIDQSLKKIRSVVTTKDGEDNSRFWGAVIGGVALGVATSAQITAGIALHNSLENAKAIMQLKDAIKLSNKAIQELKTSVGQTVVAINAVQQQINNQLVPAINTLGCQVVGNTLGLHLTQYFSEISLVFGPNLRDPTSQTLSVQAISKAFNGNFDSLFKTMGYTSSDFLDILESDSIRGRIIDVSLDDYFIIIQIEYPTLTTITGANIQLFNKISYNHKGTEWMTVFPSELLLRGSYISNIDLSTCTQTTNNYICGADTSSPISLATFQCAMGNVTSCARTRVVNSHVPRFALSGGVLFANCMPIPCRCSNPEYTIIQDISVTNVMVSSEDCNEVQIDGIYITLGVKKLPRAMYSANISLGGAVSVDPIDVGNELNAIHVSLNKTEQILDESNKILDKVNPNIVNFQSFSAILIISILLLIWFLITLIWLICLTKMTLGYRGNLIGSNRSSTVNSLSSFVA
uniref:Fusion glycoprotein F0 n=1 Tax=Dendromus rat paramyxovirus TaxID=3141873 RepID=A0AAU7E303_9MONO